MAMVGLLATVGCTEAADNGSESTNATTGATTSAAPASNEVTTVASSTGADASTTSSPATTVAAPTGKPFVIGVVNTEGAPGLDFPEFTIAFKAAAEHINNDLGGIKGRPIQLEVCIAKGSPESSQACAQELAAKHVDLVMLGLDVFVAYPTFAAAQLPLIGAVPVLPGDYTADAVYITAGNLVVQGATAAAITSNDYLGKRRVVVITSDSASTASALGSLKPALEKGGATVTVITGGENETDAGYLALMQQAGDADPEAIVSLYSEAGCVALMRARKDLGITAPVFSNTSCLSQRVTDAAGDAAIGWYFAGATGKPASDDDAIRQYVSKVGGTAPDAVDVNGFTSVGWRQMMAVWGTANSLPGDLTGAAILETYRAGKGAPLGDGGGDPVPCGQIVAYKSVCTFSIPFAEFTANGVEPAFGGASISAVELLPT